MTTMFTGLYDALLDAGASDQKARAAAEVLAKYDDRFNRLERQIDGVDRKIDRVAAGVRAADPDVPEAIRPLTLPSAFLQARLAHPGECEGTSIVALASRQGWR